MKSEILAGSPLVIAAVATLVAIVGSGRSGDVPGGSERRASEQPIVVLSDSDSATEVPLIGELTVTAERG